MKKWWFFVIVLAALLLEVTALNYFRLFYAKPALVFLAVVLSAFYLELFPCLLLAIFAGALQDIFSAAGYGINTLLYPLWALLIIKLRVKISLDTFYVHMILISVLLLANDITARIILVLLSKPVVPPGVFLRMELLQLIYTLAVFLLLSRIFKPIACE